MTGRPFSPTAPEASRARLPDWTSDFSPAVSAPPLTTIDVVPVGLVMTPLRKTAAFEVIETRPCARPPKSTVIGLSAFTDMVSVSDAFCGWR